MSTKLPEAFERKSWGDEPEDVYSEHDWCLGYNSALERTGAKELWEVLNDIENEPTARLPQELWIRLRAALNKHTNTV